MMSISETAHKNHEELWPDAKVLPGLAIRGGSVNGAGDTIKSWLSIQ